MSEQTLTQQLATWASNLRYEDLPANVVDKAKAVLLHGLMVGLASHADRDLNMTRELVLEEYGRPDGPARLLGYGNRVSRMGAAFLNCVLIHVRGQDDSYRMLTHPGSVIIPVALAEAEGNAVDGKTLITALVAAYEIQNRVARDWIPSSQMHGFRSSALFGIFGATAAAAKLHGLDPVQFSHALALGVSFASGNLETSRAGTREMTFQESVVCQAGMHAARFAARGVNGAPLALEGAAGFYYAYTGSVDGKLLGGFNGETSVDPNVVVAELGKRWELLGVTMKIYSTAGFNQPVIEACTKLAREHDLTTANVKAVRIEMNLWETVYPAPNYPPRRDWQGTNFGSTAYFAAQTIAAKGYSTTGRRLAYGGADPADEPTDVIELSKRVTVVAGDRRQYSPKVTVETTDGRVLTAEMTGDEFKWDLAMERERIQSVVPALPFPAGQAAQLIDTIAGLETLGSIDRLVDLCLPG